MICMILVSLSFSSPVLCVTHQMAAGDGEDTLHSLVLNHVPEALVVSSVGKERSYRLPFASASKFVRMFREMDARVRGQGVLRNGMACFGLYAWLF